MSADESIAAETLHAALRDRADRTTRALALVLALGATSRFVAAQRLFRVALDLGVPASALAEAALMTWLFGGFPRAIETFHSLSLAAGSGFEPPAGDTVPAERRIELGSALFAKIYGRNAAAVRQELARLAPELERAVVEDAYGRVLARPGLDAVTRELMAVTALAALDLPRQLRSHLKGALACGASRDEIMGMVELAALVAPSAAVDRARTLADATLSR